MQFKQSEAEYKEMSYEQTQNGIEIEKSHLDKAIEELAELSTIILSNMSETNERIRSLGGNVVPTEAQNEKKSNKYDGKIGYLFEIIEILKNTRELSRSINRQLEIIV